MNEGSIISTGKKMNTTHSIFSLFRSYMPIPVYNMTSKEFGEKEKKEKREALKQSTISIS